MTPTGPLTPVRAWLPRLLLPAAAAFACFGAGVLGLALAVVHPNVTAVWPASGVALAAVLLLGRRALAGAWVGQFAAAFWAGVQDPAGPAWHTCAAVAAAAATGGRCGSRVLHSAHATNRTWNGSRTHGYGPPG